MQITRHAQHTKVATPLAARSPHRRGGILAGAAALLVLSLSACAGGFPSTGTDPRLRDWVDKVEGPDVKGMDATQLESAERAMKQQRYPAAIQLYKQLVSRSPENVALYVGLAEAQRRSGDHASALATYEMALSRDPDNLDALEGKGLALTAAGEIERAGKLFERVLAKDAARWRSLNAVGILFAMRHLPDESRQYFRAALQVEPNQPTVLNNYGLTLALDRRYDAAIRRLKEAVSHAPNDSTRRAYGLNLALVHALSGDLSAAETTARPHLSEAELYNNMGYYATLSKDPALARAYLNTALTRSGKYYGKAWENLDVMDGGGGTAPHPERRKR